jgi:transposase
VVVTDTEPDRLDPLAPASAGRPPRGLGGGGAPWKIDEPLFLPPMVGDFVARDHLARFVLNLVKDDLDLAEITGTYGSERGQPPYDPTMMTALLLYSYCCGIYSSRRIAKACRERVDFMSIVALDAPDFRTISDFRKRHMKALGRLFAQILQLCEKAGLVKLGHVALDGTKIKANASKHKAMSYERMEKRAAELEAEVAKWLSAAEAADADEDKLHGRDKTGDEMPDWVSDKKRRAEMIRQAKAELEAEAKAAAEAKLKAAAEAQEKREAEGRRKGGRKAAPPSTEPDAKVQKNFTDPESRIMKSKDGFVQAYNAQAAVDAEAQIIVAHDVTQSAVDCGQLVPMTDTIETNLGRKPEQLSADAGYCSEANLEALESRNIDAYVATGRARDAVAGMVKGGATTASPEPAAPSASEPADAPTRVEAMRAKIKAGGHTSPYRLRKQLPEPVFGQIKQARGFRQFLLRGFEKVRSEWAILCTVHNLLKLAQGRSLSAALPMAAGTG